MNQPRIIVTGATGKTGSVVVTELLKTGYPVRAMVHREDSAYLETIGLAAHLGVFPWMYGNSRNAPPSNEDIARVAVEALMNPARHAGQSYRPTGPELLGADDMPRQSAEPLDDRSGLCRRRRGCS